jgi:heme/copper-type cytochrome/quinol oxidase subunit 2
VRVAAAIGCTGWTSTDTQAKLSTREWQLMVVFLLTVFTAVVLLAAGFLLGVFWLRDERTRLTALREDITQESATMQRLGHDRDADFTARGESPPTGRHHEAG